MPEGGWPAIVFNHGYIPPDVYRTTERYIAYVESIARTGYVFYRIDYRRHDRSEGEAKGAYDEPGYTIDVLNAVASLKKFPQVNPEKIGMWDSIGGDLTLRAIVISKNIKVGVIWAGVVASYPDLIYNGDELACSRPRPVIVDGADGRAGLSSTARPRKPQISEPPSLRTLTWRIFPDLYSCITVPPMKTCPWPSPSAWQSKSATQAASLICIPTMATITISPNTSPLRWTARSLFLISI
jgi:hypothetical protein